MNSFQTFPRRVPSVLLCLFLLMALSCQKDYTTEPYSKIVDPVLQKLLDRGFTMDRITDEGDYYVVEGDMVFMKNSDSYQDEPRARVSQKAIGTGLFPLLDDADQFKVYVDAFPTSTWESKVNAAALAAIGEWNSLPNCKVHFAITTDQTLPNTTFIIYDTSLPSTTWARTDSPPGCETGYYLRLNSASENYTADQLHFLITHELGHAIGFEHTDGQQITNTYFDIPDTPGTDSQSVMNSGTGQTTVPSWSTSYPNGFSTGDENAAKYLYPSTVIISAKNSPNGTSNPILVKWPPSFACAPTVSVSIKQGLSVIKSSGSITNNGFYRFTSSGLQPWATYEITVANANNPRNVKITQMRSIENL